MYLSKAAVILTLVILPVAAVNAQDTAGEIAELRQLVSEMRTDYETRISALEARLVAAERAARGAERDAEEAYEIAEQTAVDQGAGTSAPNSYNPSIGAILMGHYADVDSGWDEIPGFQPGGEIGTGGSGFSLGEAEINMQANVDAKHFGNVTIGLHEDEGELEIELEEAWFQTSDLPAGITATPNWFKTFTH